MKMVRFMAALLAAVLLTSLATPAVYALSVQSGPALNVTAEKEDSAGVALDSGFIVTGGQPLTVKSLEGMIEIKPGVDFELKQKSKDEVLINIPGDLSAATVYSISITTDGNRMSWAFQTKDSFRVKSVFPSKGSTQVPADTGIELYFNQDVKSSDIGKHFTITPALDGRFEQFDDKTVVFIPSERMALDTAYTITLDAKTPSLSGGALGEEYSFYFRTQVSEEDYNGYHPFQYYYSDNIVGTYTSADPLVVRLYASSEFKDVETSVNLYRFDTLDDFMDASRAYIESHENYIPTAGLELTAEFSQKLTVDEQYWYTAYVVFPESPEPGWYLADITTVDGQGATANRHAQKLIQITDISVYSQTANNQILFWLNDAATGEPIADATISVCGKTAKTDGDGLVIMDISYEELESYENVLLDDVYYSNIKSIRRYQDVRITDGDRQFGSFIDFYYNEETPVDQLYYTYIYTDRAVYQPSDTVNYWGVVLPRHDGVKIPSTVTLDCNDSGEYPDGLEISVGKDGTFKGQVTLDKQRSGWLRLSFYLDDRFLVSTGVTVMEYVKPVYTMDLSLDKDYYRKGDKMNASLSLNFFDGSPARNVPVYVSYESGERVSDNTDENGLLKTVYEIKASRDTNGTPVQQYMNADTSGAEDTGVYLYKYVTVFQSDYIMNAKIDKNDDGWKLALEGYAIDFGVVDSGEYNLGQKDELLYGDPADLTGTAIITEVEYIKSRTGEYYDFINKKTVERYTYDRVEKIINSVDVNIKNGLFESENLDYPENTDKYYVIDVNINAPDGSVLTQSLYLGGPFYRDDYDTNQPKRYYFMLNESDYLSYYYYYSTQNQFGVGDTINATLVDQFKTSPETGRTLLTVLGDRHYTANVTDETNFNLDYELDYIPNALLLGAYFDGSHVYTVSPTTILYRRDDNSLTMTVTPDKERYAPGDTVTLDILATGPDGKGAEVSYLLSAADEAAFAVMDQYVDILGTLYAYKWINYSQFASYTDQLDLNSGAEMGEGGNDGIRRKFMDSAAFATGKTDKNGKATVSFKLPDNITSWRLTGLAVGSKYSGEFNVPLGGQKISNVASGLPFFINQVLNTRYLAGDTIGLNLRGGGEAISSDSEVTYTVTIKDGSKQVAKSSVSGEAGQYTLLTFDSLPAGTYTVLTQAECGEYKDGIELTVEVVDSLLSTKRKVSGDLKDGLSIDAKRFPVTVFFCNTADMLYFDILYDMLSSYGSRADQAIAKAAAGKRYNALNPILPALYSDTVDVSSDELFNWSSGVRLFPYADRDVLLTAKAVAAAPDLFDAAELTGYFENILVWDTNSAVEKAAAYMGLAALRSPYLTETKEALDSSVETGDLEAGLYLATALALYGANDEAAAWYEEHLAPLLVSGANTLSVKTAENAHYNYKMTAGAAALTALIGHDDCFKLYNYINNNRSVTYLPILEKAVYINVYEPSKDSGAAFTYKSDGKTITQTFKDYYMVYMELSETQLAKGDFKVKEGNVSYTAYFTGGLESLEPNLPDGVSLDVKYSGGEVSIGENVTVSTTISFDKNAPVGYYTISLIVPSGLRFSNVTDYAYNCGWYYNIGESGNITFYINPSSYAKTGEGNAFNEKYMPASVTIAYVAKAVLPGQYIVEAPAVTYSGTNELFTGERSTIKVVE